MNTINDKYLWIVLHGGEPFMAFREMQYLVANAKALAAASDFYQLFYDIKWNAIK